MQSFNLPDEGSRAGFALEMNNLSASLNDGSQSDTRREVEELTEIIRRVLNTSYRYSPAKKPKRTTKDGGKNEGPSARSQKGNDKCTELLEICGYKMVPDVLEMDGGTWE